MGVSMDEVFNTLQVYLGSLYVNDFNRFGRTWQVNVQGDSNFRKQIEDLKLLKIRNQAGGMAPFGAMASVEDRPGPVMISRYNMYPSAAINGSPGPGTSSGRRSNLMTEVVNRRISRQAMRMEWTELALLQLQTGNTAMIVFALAVVLVFLVLAAQYESWSLPFSVILVVPMCLLCSVVGVQMAEMDINIFTQIGFIVLVGLACKNAILIVEFAKARREEGVPALPGHARRLQAPAPADHDDLARLHPRRGPAGPLRRGRLGDAAGAGDGGLRRDARRDLVRNLPDARSSTT